MNKKLNSGYMGVLYSGRVFDSQKLEILIKSEEYLFLSYNLTTKKPQIGAFFG